jgi:MGT family glycosyltransferase
MVSGYLGAKQDYLTLLTPIADAGYDAFSYDHYGQLDSDGSEDGDDHSFALLVSDLREILARLSGYDEVHVLGHCAGGALALAAAQQDPTAMSSVTVMAMGPTIVPEHSAKMKMVADVVDAQGLAVLKAVVMQAAESDGSKYEHNDARWELTKKAHVVNVGRDIADMPEWGLGFDLGKLPVLSMYGEKDRKTWSADQFADMAEQLGAKLVVIPNAGHVLQIHQPESTVAALLDFWAKTRRPHVAIFNVAEHGHVNPTLGMVEELVARGYRVSYTTTAEFAELITHAGATPVLFEPYIDKSAPTPEDLQYGAVEFANEAANNYSRVFEAFENDRPDIIAYDPYGWQGKRLAQLWEVPSIMLGMTHVAYENQLEEWFGQPLDALTCVPILDAMFRDNGHPVDIIPFLAKNENVIANIPRSFQEKLETVDPSVVFVGPGIVDRLPCTDWSTKETDKPIVVVSLGSVFTNQAPFFRTCIEAFADTEWHVVLTIGRHVDPAELGELPSNVEIHRRIPQLEVLKTASLFITHAGMGSTMESVHFGVPMVAVPQMAEQRTNAKRIKELGLGAYLPREEVTAQTLIATVREVAANQDIPHNLAAMQHEIKHAGGAKAAADVFDKISANM